MSLTGPKAELSQTRKAMPTDLSRRSRGSSCVTWDTTATRYTRRRFASDSAPSRSQERSRRASASWGTWTNSSRLMPRRSLRRPSCPPINRGRRPTSPPRGTSLTRSAKPGQALSAFSSRAGAKWKTPGSGQFWRPGHQVTSKWTFAPRTTPYPDWNWLISSLDPSASALCDKASPTAPKTDSSTLPPSDA